MSITGLHVCSLEWLDHPYVPVPRSPPSLLELPHCQVIIPSLIVLSQSHWSSTLSEFLPNYQPWHSRQPLESHWQSERRCWYLHVWRVNTDIYLCVPMMHCSQRLEDSVEHRTWSLRARGEDSDLWSWGVQAGAEFKGSCWCLGLWCFQEPPKEDLTVSEKFQLVLDVAQRAQVRRGGQAEALFNIWPRRWPDLHHSYFQSPLTESFWEAGKHPGENKEVSSSTHTYTFLKCWLWCLLNSACLCVQLVHVGSAWVDSEAVCGTVGGLHLLLPAAIQTSGLHHRYTWSHTWITWPLTHSI